MPSGWLGNDAKRITESFTAGINAYTEVATADPELMPVEFDMLGYTPSKWSADDVVRIRSNGLWRNVATEVWRAKLACEKKLDLAAQWLTLEPAWQTATPAGLDPCVIPDNVLDNYLLAKAPVDFSPQPAQTQLARLLERETMAAHNLDVGSNNWVVTGSRTTPDAVLRMIHTAATQCLTTLCGPFKRTGYNDWRGGLLARYLHWS